MDSSCCFASFFFLHFWFCLFAWVASGSPPLIIHHSTSNMGTSWQQKCFCCLLFLILVFFCVVESMDSHGDWRFFCYMLLSIFYYVVILFEPNSSSSCCSVTIQPCPGLSSLFFLSTVLIPLHGWRWINGWACRIGLPSPSSFWQHEDDVVGSYLACIPSSLSSHACERQRTVSASEWRWPESIVIILKALGSLARTHVRLAGWLSRLARKAD